MDSRSRLVFQVRRFAVLKFDAVPSAKGKTMAFDQQLRNLINAPGIAEAIAENETLAEKVCELLAKKNWTRDERQFLFDAVDHLYEERVEGPAE